MVAGLGALRSRKLDTVDAHLLCEKELTCGAANYCSPSHAFDALGLSRQREPLPRRDRKCGNGCQLVRIQVGPLSRWRSWVFSWVLPVQRVWGARFRVPPLD